MTSMTTLFHVGPGPEEFVEFNESFGSKAFLEHVWNSQETPLKQSGEFFGVVRAAIQKRAS